MSQYDDNKIVCPICGYEEGAAPDNALHIKPGTILENRYVVGKALGCGGFGVTYIGRDALLQTKVAIKEYLPSEYATRALGETLLTVFGGDSHNEFDRGKKRFIDEAKKLAKFHSAPGIVKIFDSFEANNTAYIIMELLEGETLAERLKREEKIPEETAVRMLEPVLESLKLVHKEGIIHRDIAPDNIFITDSGDVKLIDFGSARHIPSNINQVLTVMIKAGYSPEEQYRSNAKQGPYTDVYAAAATLYKMLTGIAPPDSIERRASVENSQKDPLEPISKQLKTISPNHETAIMNALNIRAENRTPDMETFLHELNNEADVDRRTDKIKKKEALGWPLWAKITIPLAAAAVIVFVILFELGILGYKTDIKKDIEIPEGKTRVPSVINMNYTECIDYVKEQGLSLKIKGKTPSVNIPENLILDQSIDGGTIVDINTVIEVSVSAGSDAVVMPSLIGLDKEEAEKVLMELGLSVKTVVADSSSIADGCVVEQSKSPFVEVPFGSEITLSISNNKNGYGNDQSAPNLVGQNFKEACVLAENEKYSIKVTEYRYDKANKRNQIISQSVKKGEALTGGVVEITVSLGFDSIKLPDVSIKDESEAKRILEKASFKTEVTYKYDSAVAKGKVIDQSPKAGELTEPYSVVKLSVSVGTQNETAPEIRFDKSELSLLYGQTEKLSAVFYPDNIPDKTIKWTSSDESIAAVKDGNVEGKSFGTVDITAEMSSGAKAVCKVTVNSLPAEVVSLANSSGAAVMADGTLYMWGLNDEGQLGDGTNITRTRPVQILKDEDVIFASLGEFSSAALTAQGELYTWGGNSGGQLGDGTTTSRNKPGKILENIEYVSMGLLEGGAIDSNGYLYLWGLRYAEQDGTGDLDLKPFIAAQNVVGIQFGADHAAFETEDGVLWCWGNNESGQLGNGSLADSSEPIPVLDNVRYFDLGMEHSAAITFDGSLYMWGNNSHGQIGDGTNINCTKPKKIMDNVVFVSCGEYNTAAITTDGSLYTWGWNQWGMLGNGTRTDSSVPVKIMDDAYYVSMGRGHSSCITNDGAIYIWGGSADGKLGLGTNISTNEPQRLIIK